MNTFAGQKRPRDRPVAHDSPMLHEELALDRAALSTAANYDDMLERSGGKLPGHSTFEKAAMCFRDLQREFPHKYLELSVNENPKLIDRVKLLEEGLKMGMPGKPNLDICSRLLYNLRRERVARAPPVFQIVDPARTEFQRITGILVGGAKEKTQENTRSKSRSKSRSKPTRSRSAKRSSKKN